MTGAASRRRAALVVLAWCAALASLAVDEPLEAHAEEPAIEHAHTVAVEGLECDLATAPPSHSSGASCYTHEHRQNHRRLDHYREEQAGTGIPTGRTETASCTVPLVDEHATDHGMGASEMCAPPASPSNVRLRWVFVRTEYADSGHDVTWHAATNTQANDVPAFQPPTYHPPRAADGRYEVVCCSVWEHVATLRALDSDVPPNWSTAQQDSLQFRSRSTRSNIAPSQLRGSRHLGPPGGAMDVDVWLLPARPGEVYVTIDVQDRRNGTTTLVPDLGPFRILPDPNQAPLVSISGATVTEGERAVLTITSSVGGGSGSVQYRTVNGTATAPSDFRPPGAATLNFSGPGTNTVIVDTVDDSDVEGTESFTVELFGESGVDIGTGTATVTILDNDSAPDPCPAGQTGTPPNCVPIGTPPCPAGQTGIPPNCVPIVVATGCDAPGTRLAALSVTDGGVDVLSGFDPGTYSYAVTIDGVSARIEATAADSQALIVSGRASPGTGSLSRTTLSQRGRDVEHLCEGCVVGAVVHLHAVDHPYRHSGAGAFLPGVVWDGAGGRGVCA